MKSQGYNASFYVLTTNSLVACFDCVHLQTSNFESGWHRLHLRICDSTISSARIPHTGAGCTHRHGTCRTYWLVSVQDTVVEAIANSLCAVVIVVVFVVVVMVVASRQATGTRERIVYDRRREIAEFVEFINEECGTSVEVPKNFQPPKVRAHLHWRCVRPCWFVGCSDSTNVATSARIRLPWTRHSTGTIINARLSICVVQCGTGRQERKARSCAPVCDQIQQIHLAV